MADERGTKDLVLAPGEYAYVADDTKGHVDTCVGPYKTSLANTERTVVFEEKEFKGSTLDKKLRLTIAPEGWYVILKNPAKDNKHPAPGMRGTLSELEVGRKIMVRGPTSFALWPGQMAQVLPGHRLRSNQYLLVCVYDEGAARENWQNAVLRTRAEATAPVTAGNEESGSSAGVLTTSSAGQLTTGATLQASAPAVSSQALASPPDLAIGKLLVIRGTDVSFFIPPTGVEVVRDEKGSLVREAVTLERLEYCVLLDENGKKRAEQGPAVVFPSPTEIFVEKDEDVADGQPRKVRKFRAIELNENSGIYVKVIAAYTDDAGVQFTEGQELFITGKDQNIYFPREEHAIIKYGDRKIHYAIAIPAGEGRYVMNRDTGAIRIEKGPSMFLPDPRREVIIRRVLDKKLVELLYPGNTEALLFNMALAGESPKAKTEVGAAYVATAGMMNADMGRGEVLGSRHMLADNATGRGLGGKVGTRQFGGDAIDRPQAYSEPRTLLLNTRYHGVVTIEVYNGYAVKLVRPDGATRVVVGPQTALLEYDERPQILNLSSGTPKRHDAPMKTVYLCATANRVSDQIRVETKDLVAVDLLVSYRASFSGDPDKWFEVDNYVRLLCDRMRSSIQAAVMAVGIEDFYFRSREVVGQAVLAEGASEFDENGLQVYDFELQKVAVEPTVMKLLVDSQQSEIRARLELQAAERRSSYQVKLQEVHRVDATETDRTAAHELAIKQDAAARERDFQMAGEKWALAITEARSAVVLTRTKGELEKQALDRESEERGRLLDFEDSKRNSQLRMEERLAEVTAAVEKLKAFTPGLVEALNLFGERNMIERVAKEMAPMAILGGTSVMDVVKRLLGETNLAKALEPGTNGAASHRETADA